MVVKSTTASDAARSTVAGPAQGSRPVRTCVGCRRRAAASELLRVVVEPAKADMAQRFAPGAARSPGTPESRVVSIIPDPRRRAPGRGAWVHPDLRCLDLAQRRRAFGRTLRVAGTVDPGPVREYVERLVQRAVPN